MGNHVELDYRMVRLKGRVKRDESGEKDETEYHDNKEGNSAAACKKGNVQKVEYGISAGVLCPCRCRFIRRTIHFGPCLIRHCYN